MPLRALKGFQRVSLKPGEKRVVRFTLDDRALSLVGPDGQRVVEPGRFTIAVGGKQPGLKGTADAATKKWLRFFGQRNGRRYVDARAVRPPPRAVTG